MSDSQPINTRLTSTLAPPLPGWPARRHRWPDLTGLCRALIVFVFAGIALLIQAQAAHAQIIFQEDFGNSAVNGGVAGPPNLPTALSTADAPYDDASATCLNGLLRNGMGVAIPADSASDGDGSNAFLFHQTGACAYAAGQAVWRTLNSITVLPNTTYSFSYWVALQNTTSPPDLTQVVTPNMGGSITILSTSTPAAQVGTWVQRRVVFATGAATTSVDLRINNATATGSGNDFGLDDIRLEQLPPPPTLTCSADPFGYLFQTATLPTDAVAVNLVTGSSQVVADDFAIALNGVAYNVLDDYMYAFSVDTPITIVRIGDGWAVQNLGLPTNWTTFGVPADLRDSGPGVGEIDPSGNYWVARNVPGGYQWAQIDMNPASPTYFEVLAAGTVNAPAGVNNLGADWSYNVNDGHLYLFSRNAPITSPPNFSLTRFRTDTHILETAFQLGAFDHPTVATHPTGVGATYADADGFIYGSDNTTGGIWRVNMTTGAVAFFAAGPASQGNDGARCYNAPVPIDFSDAPNSYGTTLASNGPRHAVVGYDSGANNAPVMLGSLIDIETDGQPTTNADSDDLDGVDDEDALSGLPRITLPASPAQSGQTVSLTVPCSPDGAFVVGYIDFDGGGTFGTGHERSATATCTGGSAEVVWTFANNLVTAKNTYLRLRIASDATEIQSPTGPASDGEVEDYRIILDPPAQTPYGFCDARAFLFQDNPSNGYAVNLVTGAAPLIFPNMANLTNGIGYNQVDNFIWGSCLWGCPTTGTASDPGYLTRVGAGGGNVDIGPIPGLPGTYHIGDVHPDGLLYLTDNGDRMYVVDLRPTSLTYLTVITETVFSGSDGNPNQPGTNLGGADWAFHPGDGQLYSVIRELDPNNNDIRYSRLLRINPATGQITNLGRLRNNANTANINFGPSTTGWGAMYFDSAGYLYISENGTGRIHRVDITDPSLPNNYRAVLFANGPSSTSNDGARCNAAPLPVDFGDAPDSYGTLLDSAGARHAVPTYNSANQTANLMLGSRIDIESDGQPTADANGDNNNGIDDEDGIGVVPPFNPGMGSYSTQVLVSNTTGNIARLCGYLDADDGTEGFNGSFNSGNERACVDVPNAPDPQVVTLNWSNLALSTAATETYLRLRLGTVAAEVGSPAGPASDGEVEDYLVSTGLNCGTGTAQTISGYAQAWTPDSTWQTATGNHARLAINAPDGQGVQVYQAQGNVLTLDMATVVPVGQVVTLYLSQPANDAFRGNVLIESSADGVTFGSPATYTPGATLPAYEPFSYSVPVGGARFIRITPQDNGQSGTAVRVDGLRYSFQYCECAAAINYVQQPSFEEFPQCSLQSGVFGNWQVIQNNVHIWGQNCTLGWVAPHGLNTVDLDGGTTGGIEQVLTGLNPGQRYNLTFYMGFNPAAGADSASMRVQVGDFDEIYTSASNATTGGFNRVYVEFTAQSSSETLRFVSLTGSGGPALLNGGGAPGFGVVIDDVRVTTKYCDDYGDAPFSYGSAAHMAIGALLGLLRDTEQTDQPTPGADGDDLNGVDDEDGVTLPAVLAPGQTITVPVTVSGGSSLLQAWIDWNGNGVFDPAEQIAPDLAVSSGTNNIDVTVPDDAVLDTTYARFRLSTQSGLGPTGPAPDGEVEDYLLTIAIPSLSASKRATLQSDADGNGFASPGDTLRYTIEIVNGGAGTALGVVYTDLPDLNTALAVGSVTTSQGAVTTGNTAGDSTVAVDIGDIASGGVVSIVYDVTINNPVAAGVTQVVNQGIVDPQNPDIPDLLTDDPDTPVPGDPTVVPIVAAPVVNAYKSATLAVDADGDGAPSPGDTLLYTIQIINSGNQDAPAVVLNDLLDAKTTLNVGSVTTDLGTVMAGNSAGDTHVEVAVGDLPGGGTQATITYQVTINNPLPAGATQVSNQGIVSSPDPNVPDILTDCTDTPIPDDACDVPVVAQPIVNAYKTATLAVDADGDGVPSPGDTLLYTIQIRNSGNQDAPGLDFLDHPDANTTLVVGSVASDRGTVTSGNTGGDMSVAVDIGTLPGGGGQANISYRVTINNPLPAGVTQVSNQGIVSSPDPNVPDILTDCTDTPELDDACDVPVVSEPVVKAYKKATLAVDADGNGVPSPGDTLLYTLQIINSGNAAAPGLSFSDSPDANTQLIVGSVSTSYGTITRGNTAGDTGIAVDIGTLPGGGAQVEFSFRVTIDNPLPAGVTQVANQGIVSSTDPSIPDVPTDDPEDPTSDDPTDVVIEARPVLDAFKRATLFTDADGNGFPSPGDTLLYTIQLFNHGNAAAPDVRFSDIPDANTLLVVGSVGTSLGTVTTGNTAGDTSIVVDIGTLPGRGVVEISYRVTVVNPLPAGVSRVLNQGVISTSDPNLPDVLTDDPATPTPEDSTEVWLTAEPLLRATKADLLFVDADGNGVPSPGDTLLYNVTVVNIGNAAATGMRFTDTPDANTTLVAGSVSSNRGTVSSGNNSGDTSIAVEVGVLPANETLEISYQVTVHTPLPPGVTQVSNQGIVHSDNDANPCPDLPLAAEVRCPQLPTDNPNTLAPHDPTVTLLAALPDLVASKRDTLVVDVGGDQTVTPGDTLLYTVLLHNQGNIAATGVVFSDPLDPNTTLVAGSVQTTGGTVTRGNNSGDRSIEINIGTLAAGAQVEISYRVVVNNPFPAGVLQVSNQGVVASNELPAIPTDDPDTLNASDPTVTQVLSGGAPKAVTLVRFTATWQGDHMLIEWESAVELDVFGFRLYRSASGQRSEAVLVTPEIVVSQGDGGGSYQVVDREVVAGSTYTYWLVEVTLSGESNDAASVTALASSDHLFLPLVSR